MTRRLAELADRYRYSSRTGSARLPFRSRWAVLSAGGIYGEVANRAAALGQRAWDSRITTGKWEKAALVMEAFWEALWPIRETDRSGLWTRPRHLAEGPSAP
jgi:phytoene synthase